MIRLTPDFKECLRLFRDHGVEYLLVGGYAVIHYGYVRTTGDMDLWIAVNPDNAARVAAALREFGFSTGLSENLFLKPGPMLRMGRPPFRIEILTSISGLDFATAYSRRTHHMIDDVEVDVIRLEDLQINKRASGRLKDLADLEKLDEVSRKRGKTP